MNYTQQDDEYIPSEFDHSSTNNSALDSDPVTGVSKRKLNFQPFNSDNKSTSYFDSQTHTELNETLTELTNQTKKQKFQFDTIQGFDKQNQQKSTKNLNHSISFHQRSSKIHSNRSLSQSNPKKIESK